MAFRTDVFKRSIRDHIVLNQGRTPTERLSALCDLLDAARAMAPRDAAACERRRRALADRAPHREQLRAHFRRLLAARGADASTGV